MQYPGGPRENETSRNAVLIPRRLAPELAANLGTWSRGDSLLVDLNSHQLAPGTLEVPGLPPDFRYHDISHYFASLLIASGSEVKVVQARLRHASAKTTLDTSGHLWVDTGDSTRAAIEAVMAAREGNLRAAEPGS